jgi:hypothetical protein
VKRNIYSTADTVQKTGLQGYQALGKQVSARTGVQLPGATGTSGLASPSTNRTEADYDDFWAENGVKETEVQEPRRPENAAFAGQSQQQKKSIVGQSNKSQGSGKDDEWENW